MRTDRIRELADFVENLPLAPIITDKNEIDRIDYRRVSGQMFNMWDWEHTTRCGTVCCIGGWTERLFDSCDARETLGLDDETATALFYPNEMSRPNDPITPTEAAAVLRHLADTGIVEWRKA